MTPLRPSRKPSLPSCLRNPRILVPGPRTPGVVADKVLEYINSFRTSPAVKLPGLTSYAEYRSRQLIRNFAHDTNDERAAATALRYGEYVIRASTAAAVNRTTVPMLVKPLQRRAMSVRWTKLPIGWRHWSETAQSTGAISAQPSMAIAVGVTYESGMWYCDIAVAAENTDNL